LFSGVSSLLLATAGWLNRLFASAAWLFFCTANWLAAIATAVLSHHSREKTLDTSTASSSVASVNNFCTADRLNWLFTAASWLNFCTTNWLASIASISFTNTKNAERICVG